ncbi:MAG: hypothetical protein KAJ62_01025 [Desulfobacteraceae bacterium]|nr:hypothetical protein [Desulfobacteraceae bacterium]
MINISAKFILSITAFLFFFIIYTGVPEVTASEVGIKTSYKQYKVYEYKGEKILCEPYVVQKDDWLYKIFRRKGVISTENFPLFIDIFSNINPGVNNVDVIEQGASILIPLRKIKEDDYKEKEPGIVQIPVINYAEVPETFKPYVISHKVNRGECVSRLIDKQFLHKDGSITQQGIKAFKLSNPGIKNIDLIYEDSSILLPDPKLLSKPWFQALFAKQASSLGVHKAKISKKRKAPSKINEYQSTQLEKYASLIGGTFSSSGNYYFPDQNNNMSKIDLSITPMISLEDGQKILLIPEDAYNESLVNALKQRWENVKIQKISTAINDYKKKKSQSNKLPLEDFKFFIKNFLSIAGFRYTQDSNVKFEFNSIQLNAVVGRVKRIGKPDLLIDFGSIKGSAFDAMREQGNDLIVLKPEEGKIKATQKLLKRLEVAFIRNPSFLKDKKVLTVNGLYIAELEPEIFIAKEKLSKETIEFLKNKNLNKNIKFIN